MNVKFVLAVGYLCALLLAFGGQKFLANYFTHPHENQLLFHPEPHSNIPHSKPYDYNRTKSFH